MSQGVVFYASRNRYGWIPSLMLFSAALLAIHAIGSPDRGLKGVGLTILPLLALSALVWVLRLIRRPSPTVTEKGLVWRLPLASRSFECKHCVGLNVEQVTAHGRIELQFNNGKRLVIPKWFHGYDEVFTALNSRYTLHKTAT